jgi:hypothetical protein
VPRTPRIEEPSSPPDGPTAFIAAARRAAQEAAHPEKHRQSLLQRLASVGRKKDEPVEPRREPGVSEYAKRPAQRAGPSDANVHRRSTAAAGDPGDDLDVPAFLRRQSGGSSDGGDSGPSVSTGDGVEASGTLSEDELRSRADANRILRSAREDTEVAAGEPIGDSVDISAFAPPDCSPGESLLVQVYLHLPTDEDEVRRRACVVDPSAVSKGVATLEVDLKRGERIDIVIEAPDFAIGDPRQTIVWRGRPRACTFELVASMAFPLRPCPIRVYALLGSVPVGQLSFRVLIRPNAKSEPQQQGVSARAYRSAFISYASSDRHKALRFAQGLRAAKIKVFQDVLSLDPGQRWEQQLFLEIDNCDLFLLCWSDAASRSEWVIKEALYALERQQRDTDSLPDITPVILEGPPPPQRPEALKHLHFNDVIAYLIAAEDAQRAARPDP